nr:S24 family peptidase [Neisseria sp. HSC-16F19]
MNAAELAKLALPMLPKSPKGIAEKAQREGWPFRKRAQRGGGVEYAISGMPADIRGAINEKPLTELLERSMQTSSLSDEVKGFTQRVSEVVDMLGKQAHAARSIGVQDASIKRWVTGQADPSRTNLIRIAEAAGVNIAWLATGEGPKFKDGTAPVQTVGQKESTPAKDVLGNPVDIEEFVFIPRYDVKAAAGHGYPNHDHPAVLRMAFRRYWVENYLRANPADLSVIAVKGDSMEGVLNDGDNILVNHAQNRPGTGLYVVRIGEDLIVKRIQTMPGGKLLITSANEAYAPFEIDLTDGTADVQIIGRVVWFGRQI